MLLNHVSSVGVVVQSIVITLSLCIIKFQWFCTQNHVKLMGDVTAHY